jgi:hypothetical protein
MRKGVPQPSPYIMPRIVLTVRGVIEKSKEQAEEGVAE